MSANKHINVICIVIIVLMLVTTVLFMNGKSLGIQTITDKEEEEETNETKFTQNDEDGKWDSSDATKIELCGDTVNITGNGAYYANNEISIVLAGKYVVSGTLNNGSIKVDCDKDDKVWIMLDNADISCDNTSPINVCQAKKVFITLNEGTENSITFTDTEDEKLDGAIYSKDNLTINGSGKLTVTSEKYHGIVCNDNLVFTGGNITITAKADGLHANDLIKISEATMNISAEDDGISASNDDGNSSVYIKSGDICITDCYEGIEANNVTIAGGKINISPSDDGINANGTNSQINISGGEITILNEDGVDADGLDSNGSINISGGYLFISVIGTGSNNAIDYGSESGGECVITGGTVIACGGSTMAEEMSSSSTQGFIMKTVSGQPGSSVVLKDSDGNTLIDTEVPYSFSLIVVSTPDISVGDTVYLTVGGSTEEITIDNTYTATGMGGGMGTMEPGNNMQGDMPSGEMPSGEMPSGDMNGNTPPDKPDGSIN